MSYRVTELDKTYVVKQDSDIQYFIYETETEVGTKYIMERSNSSTWSEDVRGTEVVNILDDGNGISIHMEKGKLKDMDYAQQRELQILLGFIQKISSVDSHVEILLWEDPIVL